jgi:hypothetical protein
VDRHQQRQAVIAAREQALAAADAALLRVADRLHHAEALLDAVLTDAAATLARARAAQNGV